MNLKEIRYEIFDETVFVYEYVHELFLKEFSSEAKIKVHVMSIDQMILEKLKSEVEWIRSDWVLDHYLNSMIVSLIRQKRIKYFVFAWEVIRFLELPFQKQQIEEKLEKVLIRREKSIIERMKIDDFYRKMVNRYPFKYTT